MSLKEIIQSGSGLARSCRAIEIGTTAIRLAVLKKRGKKVRVVETREAHLPRKAPGPPPPDLVAETLRELVAADKNREEALCSSLPIGTVFVRSLEFPFSKMSQIRQVIASEAELHVPFPLNQIVIDFWPVNGSEGGKTRVVMVAVKKEALQAHLELFASVGLDPSAFTLDALGLARAYSYAGGFDPDEVTMLLDVGAGHTGAIFFSGGDIKYLRSFAWGGDTVTTAVMDEVGCSFARAEELKKASDLDPAIRTRVEAARKSTLAALEAEIVRTIHSAAPLTDGRPTKNVILTGGAVRQPGLSEELLRKLKLQLLEVDPLQALDLPKTETPPPGTLGSIGTALSEIVPTKAKVNFRRWEFSFHGSWESIKRRLIISAVLAGSLVVLLATGFFMQIKVEENKYRRLGENIQALLKETLPEGKLPASGGELTALKDGLQEEKAKLGYYQDLVSVSAFDILREISRIIPEDLKVQVVTLEIDRERVRFVGRTDSFGSADKIKNSFRGSDYFQADKIREGETKTKKVGGKVVTVEFNFTIPRVEREI